MAVKCQATPDEQLARAKAEGWQYEGDMRTEGEVLDLLYSLARILKPEVAVETGTYAGHGTKAIATALEANGKGHLWTVESDPELTPKYAEMELDRTTFVNDDSVRWSAYESPEQIDFAFVDCAEQPKDRVSVFANLLPKIRQGGMILAHDTHFLLKEEYLDKLIVLAGPPSLLLPALNGIAIWSR